MTLCVNSCVNSVGISKLQGADEPVYFTPKVGAYDMWAIKYGYMEVEGEHVLEENEVGQQVIP